MHFLGFYSYPGGKIKMGGSVKLLLRYAFDVQENQIVGPSWAETDQFDLVALPAGYTEQPAMNSSRVNVTPTFAQRKALQALLMDRFGLKYHRESREEQVYLLERGDGPLQIKDPADKTIDPRGGVLVRPGGVVDGTAIGKI